MNTEEDEFKRIEAEAKRRAAQNEDDDTQVYTSEVAEEYLYRLGYEDGAAAEREACARMFDEAMPLVPFVQNDQSGCLVCGFTPKLAAEAIRARGQA